jgi:hypothetical protein
VNFVTLFDVGAGECPQTFWAQTVFARDWHRQAQAFVLAPAIAGDIAGKFGSAIRAGKTSRRRDSCPICHDS